MATFSAHRVRVRDRYPGHHGADVDLLGLGRGLTNDLNELGT